MGDRPSYPDPMVLLVKQLLLDLPQTSTSGGMSWSNHHLENITKTRPCNIYDFFSRCDN